MLAALAVSCDLRGGEAEDKAKKKQQPPAVVVLGEVSGEGVVESRSFFGNVTAASDANLSAAEAGRVTVVHVEEGDRVEEGHLLVELDDQLARAQLSEALASKMRTDTEEQQATLEVERFERMQEELVVSDLETERKKTEADSLGAAKTGAAAQVARGAEVVRRHKIVAPFSGTVARVRVDPGDWINPGEVAVQLLTDSHLEVEVRVPAHVLDSLDHVEGVRIEHGERSVPATVDAAVNALDPRTRTALLRVVPQESPPWLRVGAGVDVAFSFRRDDGLTVSRDALVYGVASKKVFKVVDEKAVPVPVELLVGSENRVLVRADELSVGDRIVVKGNERLRPGQKVTTEGAIVPEGSSKE